MSISVVAMFWVGAHADWNLRLGCPASLDDCLLCAHADATVCAHAGFPWPDLDTRPDSAMVGVVVCVCLHADWTNRFSVRVCSRRWEVCVLAPLGAHACADDLEVFDLRWLCCSGKCLRRLDFADGLSSRFRRLSSVCSRRCRCLCSRPPPCASARSDTDTRPDSATVGDFCLRLNSRRLDLLVLGSCVLTPDPASIQCLFLLGYWTRFCVRRSAMLTADMGSSHRAPPSADTILSLILVTASMLYVSSGTP